MPTEIKIILPVTQDDDTFSTCDDTETVASREDGMEAPPSEGNTTVLRERETVHERQKGQTSSEAKNAEDIKNNNTPIFLKNQTSAHQPRGNHQGTFSKDDEQRTVTSKHFRPHPHLHQHHRQNYPTQQQRLQLQQQRFQNRHQLLWEQTKQDLRQQLNETYGEEEDEEGEGEEEEEEEAAYKQSNSNKTATGPQSRGAGSTRVPISQHQYHIHSPKDERQKHVMVLATREIPTGVVGARAMRGVGVGQRPFTAFPASPRRFTPAVRPLGTVKLAITRPYDVDSEHHDIMLKALHSYQHHRRKDRAVEIQNNVHMDENTNNMHAVFPPETVNTKISSGKCPNGMTHFDAAEVVEEKKEAEGQSPTTPKEFRLSRCQLKFNEEMRGKKNVKPAGSASLTLFPPEVGDGVLVDSVGHVYRPKRSRPWSALPSKLKDIRKSGNKENNSGLEQRPNSSPGGRSPSADEKHLKIVTLKIDKKMAQPIPRSAVYQMRNRTTHSWSEGGNQMMSQSLPTSSFLHKEFSSASSTPRSSRDATSSSAATSPLRPAGKGSGRPSSSYSYDGGFFLGAHTGQAGYFVIHPDWVSEAMTIKKLSIGQKQDGPLSTLGSGLRSVSRSQKWDGRRCMSAPPPKLRNPIVWDSSDPIDIPSK